MLGQSGGVPHWLGTDQLGRDQLARLLYGGRVSLTVAMAAAAISVVLGVTVGTLAGYFGGVTDDSIMWFINTVVSIPTIYLLIIIVAIYSPSPLVLTLFLGFLGLTILTMATTGLPLPAGTRRPTHPKTRKVRLALLRPG